MKNFKEEPEQEIVGYRLKPYISNEPIKKSNS